MFVALLLIENKMLCVIGIRQRRDQKRLQLVGKINNDTFEYEWDSQYFLKKTHIF